MNADTEQLLKKLHASLCPDKLEAEICAKFAELEAKIERHKLHIKHIGNDALRTENNSYVTALAACRDAFPVPTVGSRLDDWYCSAMADPLEVPAYVKTCVIDLTTAKEPVFKKFETSDTFVPISEQKLVWECVGGGGPKV